MTKIEDLFGHMPDQVIADHLNDTGEIGTETLRLIAGDQTGLARRLIAVLVQKNGPNRTILNTVFGFLPLITDAEDFQRQDLQQIIYAVGLVAESARAGNTHLDPPGIIQ